MLKNNQKAVKPPKMGRQVSIMNDVRNQAVNAFADQVMNQVRETHDSSITVSDLETMVNSTRDNLLCQPKVNK